MSYVLACTDDGSDCIACDAHPLKKPHSHSTLSTCRWSDLFGKCIGQCTYVCDAGYVWNPVTQTCDLIPVSTGAGRGSKNWVLAMSVIRALQQNIRHEKCRHAVVIDESQGLNIKSYDTITSGQNWLKERSPSIESEDLAKL